MFCVENVRPVSFTLIILRLYCETNNNNKNLFLFPISQCMYYISHLCISAPFSLQQKCVRSCINLTHPKLFPTLPKSCKVYMSKVVVSSNGLHLKKTTANTKKKKKKLQKDTSQDQNRKNKIHNFLKSHETKRKCFCGDSNVTEEQLIAYTDLQHYMKHVIKRHYLISFLPDNTNKPSAPFKWVPL